MASCRYETAVGQTQKNNENEKSFSFFISIAVSVPIRFCSYRQILQILIFCDFIL